MIDSVKQKGIGSQDIVYLVPAQCKWTSYHDFVLLGGLFSSEWSASQPSWVPMWLYQPALAKVQVPVLTQSGYFYHFNKSANEYPFAKLAFFFSQWWPIYSFSCHLSHPLPPRDPSTTVLYVPKAILYIGEDILCNCNNKSSADEIIIESVDSICRDSADTQYMLIQTNLSKSPKQLTYKLL